MGVRVDVRPAVHEVDAGHHRGARGQLVAVHLERLGQPAHDQRQHRSQAQRLVRDGVGIGAVLVADLVLEARQHARVANDPLERPGQRGRRRLVAGHEQRHQLVAQFALRHRRSVLVTGSEQHREDVVAPLEVGCRAAPRDLLVECLVHPADHPGEAGPARAGQPLGAEQRGDQEVAPARGELEHRADAPRHALESRGILDTEHGAQDHLERDRLHARPDRERLAGRPARDLALGDLPHQLAVALHPLAVEGRQQQLALAQMRRPVEQQHRFAAHHRPQDHVGLARAQVLRVAGEHALDRLGVADQHPLLLRGDADREAVAVPAMARLQEGRRAHHPAQGLEGAGQRGARGQSRLRGRGTRHRHTEEYLNTAQDVKCGDPSRASGTRASTRVQVGGGRPRRARSARSSRATADSDGERRPRRRAASAGPARGTGPDPGTKKARGGPLEEPSFRSPKLPDLWAARPFTSMASLSAARHPRRDQRRRPSRGMQAGFPHPPRKRLGPEAGCTGLPQFRS